MLLGAGYLQYNKGLIPCPLCQLQRFMLGAIGLIAFFAIIHNPKPKNAKIYSILTILSSISGSIFATRQVQLQSQSIMAASANCGVSLDYVLDTLPILEAIKFIFQGNGSCAEVSWRIYGFSLAELTIGTFIIFILLAMFQILTTRKSL